MIGWVNINKASPAEAARATLWGIEMRKFNNSEQDFETSVANYRAAVAELNIPKVPLPDEAF